MGAVEAQVDDREKEIATRQVDALVALTTIVEQLREVVITLNSSVTHLTSMGLRLEAKLDAQPAE